MTIDMKIVNFLKSFTFSYNFFLLKNFIYFFYLTRSRFSKILKEFQVIKIAVNPDRKIVNISAKIYPA